MTNNTREIILVPTDFTENSEKAIQYAVESARKANLDITLIHVITKESRDQLKKEHLGVEEITRRLEEFRGKYETNGINISYTAREGNLYKVIGQVADELKVRFMVVCTHGKKGLQHIFGSYIFKLVRQSPVPVTVIQHDSPLPEYKSIAFPVNIHIEPRQMVDIAISLNKNLGYKLLLFKQLVGIADDVAKIDIITDQIEETLKKENIPFEIVESKSKKDYESQLIAFAGEHRVDSILMMTDSKIDEPSFDNSSWSEKLILNRENIPVICINPVYLGEMHFRI